MDFKDTKIEQLNLYFDLVNLANPGNFFKINTINF